MVGAFSKRLAKRYLNLYDRFLDDYIRPSAGEKRANTVKRVKIAVIDSGMNYREESAALRGCIDHVKSQRCDADRLALNPIRARHSFIPGSSMEDQCGHGTRVLQLLLKTAPEADFYVAKVSTTLSDESPLTANYVAAVMSDPYDSRRHILTGSRQ